MSDLKKALAKVQELVDSQSEHSPSMEDPKLDNEESKARIRRDVFTTEAEALARAEEIGCVGSHTHDENGNKVYMPCRSHQEYRDKTGRDVRSDTSESEAMTEDVKAEIKAIEDDNKEYGTFEGYGSVFGNTDLGNDVIQKGAFTKSLRDFRTADNVKLLYQHKSDMPIGKFDEIYEDSKGLVVRGRLALRTQAGKEAYELLKMGALDGLSIGFKVDQKSVSYEKDTNRRIIKEVKLMEVSLVTFPMNPRAVVRQVKGEDITVREWEKGLRDAFQLSRSEAKIAATAVFKSFDEREAHTDSEVVDAIKVLTNKFKL